MAILLIGSLPPPIGGTTLLLKQLVRELSNHDDLSVETINTSRIRGTGVRGFVELARTGLRILNAAFRVDVISLHCATSALPLFGFVVLVISRLARKKLILRKFAGTDFLTIGPFRSWLSKYVLAHSDLCLVETKKLLRLAKSRGIKSVEWFPNCRPIPPPHQRTHTGKKGCRNFVFVGHVNEVKGILEIIEIDCRLPPTVSIDVFGPFTGRLNENSFKPCRQVHYRGILDPEQVIATLQRYDALLLPTYHEGEGYPGVIIEAYVAGIPVVATSWCDIPELVDEASGILIGPKQPDELLDAMMRLCSDDELCARLRGGALKKSLEFSSKIWANKFIEYCANVL